MAEQAGASVTTWTSRRPRATRHPRPRHRDRSGARAHPMPPATLCCTPERRGVARARGSRTRGGLAAAGQRRQGGSRRGRHPARLRLLRDGDWLSPPRQWQLSRTYRPRLGGIRAGRAGGGAGRLAGGARDADRRPGGVRALRDGVAQGGQAAVGRAGAAAEPARWRVEMWRGSLLGDNTLAKHGAEAAAEWPQLPLRCGAAAQARHVRVEQLGGVDGSRVMRACCCGDVT